MEKSPRHTGKKIIPHSKVVAAETYLGRPNILRGDQSPAHPDREIEQMLHSVRLKGIVTPETTGL